VRAEHQQIRLSGGHLREDRVVHQPLLLQLAVDLNLGRDNVGEGSHLTEQSRSVVLFEHERRQIKRGQIDEHVQQRQPRLVPARDRGGMCQRMMRDVREVDRAQDTFDGSAAGCRHWQLLNRRCLAPAEANASTGPTPRNRGTRLSAAIPWLRLYSLRHRLETWGLIRSLVNFLPRHGAGRGPETNSSRSLSLT
jgi:hypothetical protein